jgi:hypothetical protein
MLTRIADCRWPMFLYVHRSPAVFSDPDAFIPDRWLGEDAKTHEASLVSILERSAELYRHKLGVLRALSRHCWHFPSLRRDFGREKVRIAPCAFPCYFVLKKVM